MRGGGFTEITSGEGDSSDPEKISTADAVSDDAASAEDAARNVVPNPYTTEFFTLDAKALAVTAVHIPATVESIDPAFFQLFPNAASIDVAAENIAYASQNGALYSADLTSLILVPEGVEGNMVLPDSLATVPAYVLSRCNKLSAVTLGSTNSSFITRNGILYTSDETTLLAAPPSLGATATLSPACERIAEGAFAGNMTLRTIVVNGDVETVGAPYPNAEAGVDADALDDAPTPAFEQEVIDNATITLIGDCSKAPWEAAGFTSFAAGPEPGSAIEPVEGSGFAFDLLDDYTLAVRWQGEEGAPEKLEMPAYGIIEGIEYKVSAIAESGFEGQRSIQQVVLPEGIAAIGDAAFKDASALNTITIPGSVSAVGDEAFSGCEQLVALEMGEGIRTIGHSAFAGIAQKAIVIPASVKAVGDYAFANSPNLEMVVALGDVDAVGQSALAGSSGLDLYVPYRADGAYAWSAGLPATGNHLMPYGVRAPESTIEVNVGEQAELFSEGYLEAPGAFEVSYAYKAKPISISDAGTIEAKEGGASNVEVTLTLDVPRQVVSGIVSKQARLTHAAYDPNTAPTVQTAEVVEATQPISVAATASVLSVERATRANDGTGGSGSAVGDTFFWGGSWFSDYMEFEVIAEGYDNGTRGQVRLLNIDYIDSPGGTLEIPEEVSDPNNVDITYRVTDIGDNGIGQSVGYRKIDVLTIPATITQIDALSITWGLKDTIGEIHVLGNTKMLSGISAQSDTPPIILYDRSVSSGWISAGFGAFYHGQEFGLNFEEDGQTITFCYQIIDIQNRAVQLYDMTGSGNLDLKVGPTVGLTSNGATVNFTPTSVGTILFSGLSNARGSLTFASTVTNFEEGAFRFTNNLNNIGKVYIEGAATSVGNCGASSYGFADIVLSTSEATSSMDLWTGAGYHVERADYLVYTPINDTECSVKQNPDCKPSGFVNVPDTVTIGSKQYKVTAIAQSAFFQNANITSIRLPSSLKRIESHAFFQCGITQLSSGFPNGLEYIGVNAFIGTKIKSFNIPDSVKEIGSGCFAWSTSIESIHIGSGVTTIQLETFHGSSNLTSITGITSVQSIGDEAFEGTKLTALDLPANVKTIGKKAFYNCDSLNSVVLRGVTSIGDEAFGECSDLYTVALNDGLTSVGICAFYGHDINIEVNGSVSTVGVNDYTAWGDGRLDIVMVTAARPGLDVSAWEKAGYWIDTCLATFDADPYGVFENGSDQVQVEIWYNQTMASEDIPTVSSKDPQWTFAGWFLDDARTQPFTYWNTYFTEDQTLYADWESNIPDASEYSWMVFTSNGDGTCSVGARTDPPAGTTTVAIPGAVRINGVKHTVTSIAQNGFENKSITGVTFPDTLKSIGAFAFNGCNITEQVVFPNGLEYIEQQAFMGLKNETITIPNSVTSIGDHCFAWSTLKSVQISSKMTDIRTGTFFECSNLASITGLDNISYIGTAAFKGTAFGSLDLPANVKTIEQQAFSSCPQLDSVILRGVVSIGGEAFADCGNLTSVKLLSEEVASVGVDAFRGVKFGPTMTVEVSNRVAEVMASTEYDPYVRAAKPGVDVQPWADAGYIIEAYDLYLELGDYGSYDDETMEIAPSLGYNYIDVWYNYPFGMTFPNGPIPSDPDHIFAGWFADRACTQPFDWNAYQDDREHFIFAKWEEIPDASEYDWMVFTSNGDGTCSVGARTSPSTYIETIVIPETVRIDGVKHTVTSVADYGFNGIKNFSKVQFPSTVTSLGDNAFSSSSINEVTLPDSVTYMGVGAFEICESLERVDTGDGLEQIPDNAFYDCPWLRTFRIGSSVDVIGISAFENTPLCSNFVIPESVTYINQWAFLGSSELDYVTVLGATRIENSAFANCSNLTDIILNEGLEYVGKDVFHGTSTLTIHVNGTVPTVGDTTDNGQDHFRIVSAARPGVDVGAWNDAGYQMDTYLLFLELCGHGSYSEIDVSDVPSLASGYLEIWYNYPFGTQFSDGPIPSDPNYVFCGWYLDEAYAQPFDWNAYQSTEELTAYAKWEKRHTYTIDYNANANGETVQVDGVEMTSIPSVQVECGASYTLLQNVVRSGSWKFDGWNTSHDGTGTHYAAGAEVTDLAAEDGQITLYAEWTSMLVIKAPIAPTISIGRKGVGEAPDVSVVQTDGFTSLSPVDVYVESIACESTDTTAEVFPEAARWGDIAVTTLDGLGNGASIALGTSEAFTPQSSNVLVIPAKQNLALKLSMLIPGDIAFNDVEGDVDVAHLIYSFKAVSD